MSDRADRAHRADHADRRVLVPVVGAFLAAALLLAWILTPHRPALAAVPAPGAGSGADQGVVVSATGDVTGTPDVLRLSLGVEVVRPRVEVALRDASAAMTRVRASLRAAGVADKDVQTTSVAIDQNYGKNGPSGFHVSQDVTVKVRKLDRAGALLDAAAKAGGDAVRVRGVSFAIEDDDALLTEAREKAFAAAKAKATTYAKASERGLGQVVSISETVNNDGPRSLADGAFASSPTPSAPMPIAPGEQQLSVTVTVRWQLG